MKRGTLKHMGWQGKIGNERGSMFILAYFVVVLLIGFGAAFAMLASNESRAAERQRMVTVAFHIAEAGIERGLYDLRHDFLSGATPSWADGGINGYAVGPNMFVFYAMPYSDTTLNGGSYAVSFKNALGGRNIWLRSTGTYRGVSHTLQVYVRMINVSPWGNAIFAGAGASGALVNGNVDIRGSVHILGNGLADGDYAIDLGGTAQLVGNNYRGLDPSLAALVPLLPVAVYNGELVQTLNSVLRVKKGLVGLSGTATVGEPQVAGNIYKETVDEVYVTNGYGGNQGTANVYSDNGFINAYDLGDAVSFPSLSDPSPDDSSQTNQQYFRNNALILTNELSSLTPSSNFSYSDANGSISMDGAGNLTISGRVYVDGNNNLAMSVAGSKKTITYSGRGTLLVTGNVAINANLVTSGVFSFPTNIIGIMTPNSISFTTAGIDAMGVFYAEDSVVVTKQTDIMGTIVSNYFDMGTNVPSIFQVPSTENNLPPSMIGSSVNWFMVVSWQRI